MTNSDGSKYSGEFLDGKYHGKGEGTLIEPDGTKYEGDFLNGKFNG